MSGSMNGPKNWPTKWQDSVKAAALATAAERTATPVRNVSDASYSWNAYDVWLSRVQPPRDIAGPTSMTDPVIQRRHDTAPRN